MACLLLAFVAVRSSIGVRSFSFASFVCFVRSFASFVCFVCSDVRSLVQAFVAMCVRSSRSSSVQSVACALVQSMDCSFVRLLPTSVRLMGCLFQRPFSGVFARNDSFDVCAVSMLVQCLVWLACLDFRSLSIVGWFAHSLVVHVCIDRVLDCLLAAY